MKQIDIPLIYKGINIHVGEKELHKYIKWCEKCGVDTTEIDSTSAGHACGSFIWIKEPIDNNTVFHEVQHVLDNIFIKLGIMFETEFKAYIAGYVYNKAHEWLNNG